MIENQNQGNQARHCVMIEKKKPREPNTTLCNDWKEKNKGTKHDTV